MRIETTRLTIAAEDGVSIEDITAEIDAFVRSTGIESGLCVMTIARGSGFLSLAPELDEAFDDLLRLARTRGASPAEREGFDRPAGDAESPADRSGTEPVLQAPPGVLADCLSLAVSGGAVQLGNWDAIVCVDTDGPGVRAVDVTLMGAAGA